MFLISANMTYDSSLSFRDITVPFQTVLLVTRHAASCRTEISGFVTRHRGRCRSQNMCHAKILAQMGSILGGAASRRRNFQVCHARSGRCRSAESEKNVTVTPWCRTVRKCTVHLIYAITAPAPALDNVPMVYACKCMRYVSFMSSSDRQYSDIVFVAVVMKTFEILHGSQESSTEGDGGQQQYTSQNTLHDLVKGFKRWGNRSFVNEGILLTDRTDTYTSRAPIKLAYRRGRDDSRR